MNKPVIMITGAGNGVGKALSVACAKMGAELILLDKNIASLERLDDELKQINDSNSLLLPVDLLGATPKDWQEIAQGLSAEFSQIDAMVHNAVHFTGLKPFEHIQIKDWYNAFQVNVHAPFLVTQALLPLLKQSAKPKLLFATDANATAAKPYWADYAISKTAIQQLAKLLANEWQDTCPIKVIEVELPAVATRLRRLAYPGEDPNSIAKPEDITELFTQHLF